MCPTYTQYIEMYAIKRTKEDCEEHHRKSPFIPPDQQVLHSKWDCFIGF
jgi:hypothetical protein